jgi:hypothetical protein
MIRRFVTKGNVLVSLRSLSTVTPISPKTTVILDKLHDSATKNKLTELLKDLNHRRVLIEPGCSLHVINEAEAEVCGKILESSLDLKVLL